MSFNVHYEIRLENLFDLFVESLHKNRSKDPLVPAFVVVQTEGMKKWLSLMLAQRLSICANVKFFTPNGIIDYMAGKFFGEHVKADKKKLAWEIYAALPDLLENRYFDEIRNYTLPDKSGMKRYQLSEKIADIFDQYQVYRPGMLKMWEEGRFLNQKGEELPEEYRWQQVLWQQLSGNEGINRGDLYLRMLKQLPTSAVIGDGETVFIFGISVLPPLYVKIFENLGNHFGIEMFLQSPSREYFGTEKFYKNTEQEELKEGVNPLVANLARTGSEFFDTVSEHIDYFSSREDLIGKGSLLDNIQNDIVLLKPPEQRLSVEEVEDGSIFVNSCHSPMREVQVLYDHLLKFFDEDKSLKPSDIIVMTPDIEEYAPYVEAVFGSSVFGDVNIPYCIADKTIAGIYSTVQLFNTLLKISSGRLKFSELFQLLEKEIIYTKFDLTPMDVDRLKSWCKQAKMKWGWDREISQLADLPFYERFTVLTALDRLFLGSAVLPYEWESFGDIVPNVSIEGESFEIIGRFAKFVHTVKEYREILNNSYAAEEWAGILSGMLLDLFSQTSDSDGIEEINSGIRAFQRYTEGVIEDKLPVEVVTEFFKSYFRGMGRSSGYMDGGVTFCSMVPMRSIPFKVICMIGMNDASFPRVHKPMEFDLTAVFPEKGDRSPKDNDRYLFLETLMSARERLYLSYTGQSIKDNSDIPPSPLVSELMEYIRQISLGEFSLTKKHKLHPFSTSYFDESETLFSYSRHNYQIAQSYSKDSQEYGLQERKEDIAADVVPSEINLEDIAYFYANPIRYYFRNTLGIFPEELTEENEDVEPLNLDNLQKTILKSRLAEKSIFSEDEHPALNDMVEYYSNSGFFPPADFGKFLQDVTKYDVSRFVNNIRTVLHKPVIREIDFSLVMRGKKININGECLLSGSKNVLARMAKLKNSDKIKAWIYHIFLLYDLLKSEDTCEYSELTTFFYAEDDVLQFTDELDKYKSDDKKFYNLKNYIDFIVKTYLSGRQNPLPLFPDFGYEYSKKIEKEDIKTGNFAAAWWKKHIYKYNNKFYMEKLYGDNMPDVDRLGELAGIIYLPVVKKELIIGA